MISGIFLGLKAYLKGTDYYLRPFVLKYFLISGIISLSVFLALSSVIYGYGDNLGLSIANKISGQAIQSGILESIISIFSRLALWIIVILIFKYIILIIVAPIMSVLSEKIEYYETGRPMDSSLSIKTQLYLIFRGTRLAVSNLSREIFITVILLFISLIPGAIVITTPMIFLVQSYYAGFGNMDFFMERHLNNRDSRRFVSNNKGVAVANGAVFLLLILVPFVGVFVAPTFATIAATLSGIELLDEY